MKPIIRILAFLATYLLIFILLKPAFMLVHLHLYDGAGIGDWLSVMWHGLSMDCSMAGYLTVIPALLTTVATLCGKRATDLCLNVYIAITSVIIAMVAVTDAVLYGYWNFRLDTTPLFYFASSPSSALASTGAGTVILAVAVIAVISFVLYKLIRLTAMRLPSASSRPWLSAAGCLIVTVSLILPIRGSLTVSTMNLSRAYFSPEQRLNHAAINPVFSLMYSATHQNKFSSQFRFFDNDVAARLFDQSQHDTVPTACDSVAPLFKVAHPDIYIIILESFNSHLLPSLGGEAIATGLDSIASHGLLFSGFYASGSRTDRAIPAILSGFPAQPTTSLMKYARKIERTPSLPKALHDGAGYRLAYYYGGDANFTNMLAYLVSSGFDTVVSDKDFSMAQRTGKWGAHDHVVFDRLLSDIAADTAATPVMRVIQTSSSHEPFEVPYADPRFADSPRKNAFAYADRALTAFIDSLHATPAWERSVIFITADHLGVYPRDIDDLVELHHVPLVITGGALNMEPATVPVVADQTALASTILSASGICHADFTFSRDIFDPSVRHAAFFSRPGWMGMVTATDTVVYNLDSDTPLRLGGDNAGQLSDFCKATLQTVYNTLDNL